MLVFLTHSRLQITSFQGIVLLGQLSSALACRHPLPGHICQRLDGSACRDEVLGGETLFQALCKRHGRSGVTIRDTSKVSEYWIDAARGPPSCVQQAVLSSAEHVPHSEAH